MIGKNTIIKYITGFVITAALLTAVLCLAAKIPKEAIRPNMLDSAEYLNDREVYFPVIEGVKGSIIDRYADSILLNIAWSYDTDHPLRSTMLSAYYYTPDHEENEDLLTAVRDDIKPNQQYLRYWHGSLSIVKPLLTLMSVRGIYIFNAIVLVILLLSLLIVLIKLREGLAAFGILLGVVMTSWWFVPMSLEYTWTCLTALAACLAVIALNRGNKADIYGLIFMITGIITVYLDFLTTETLTLLLPLLIFLRLERKKGRAFVITIEAAVSWTIGYALMWVLKWLLAAAVFKENVMPYVKGHIEERLGGTMGINDLSRAQFMEQAVLRNIKCLFPLEYGTAGMAALIIAFLLLICFVFKYRIKTRDFDKKQVLVFGLLALLPFVRFLVLHNHSYRHYFFTYRALTATILALVLIFGEITENKATKLAIKEEAL